MKEVLYEGLNRPAYSLKDSHISKIEAGEDFVKIYFEYGFCEIRPPYKREDGYIEVTKVCKDYCRAYLMCYEGSVCGIYGDFTGKKISLDSFLKEFPKISIDVIEETFGNHIWKINGIISKGRNLMEIVIEINYSGEIKYISK